MLKLAWKFVDDTPAFVKWNDFGTSSCSTALPTVLLKPVRPGMGNRTLIALDAVVVFRTQLYLKAIYEAIHSSHVFARAAWLRLNEKGWHESSILMLRIQAGRSYWYPRDRKFVLVCDEMPCERFEELASSLAPINMLLCGGDRNQFKTSRMACR